MKKERQAIEVLERYGATNIKGYVLVNNWGFKFDLDGERCDARFWENCYGASPMVWGVHGKSSKCKEIEKELNG